MASAVIRPRKEDAPPSLNGYDLSIIKLAEPVLSSTQKPNNTKRGSDVSSQNASENPTPTSLATDLVHYKELFSKLRFSYLEQVTKEKFLRAIVGDPPLIVEHADNVRLEQELVIKKAALKAQKEDVATLVAELESLSRDLSSRHETVQLQTTQLATLPAEIEQLEAMISKLQAQQADQNLGGPSQNMSLPATLALLSEQDAEAEHLDAQIRALQSSLPKQTRELENLRHGLRLLDMEKQQAITAAQEAIRRKQQGENGIGDDLELKGRWYAGVQKVMTSVLGSEA